MPAVLPVYRTVVDALEPLLARQRDAIVTIDGHANVGKTTLGRYLAWTFNVTLVECDLFLIPAADYLIALDDQVNRIVERRVATPAPVIVEGLAIRQLLKRIGRSAAFSVYLERARRNPAPAIDRLLADYDAEYRPRDAADLVLAIDV